MRIRPRLLACRSVRRLLDSLEITGFCVSLKACCMTTPNQPWPAPFPPGSPPNPPGPPTAQMPLPPHVAMAQAAPYPPVPTAGAPLRAPIPVATPARPVPVYSQPQPVPVAAPGAPIYPSPPAYSPQPVPQAYAPQPVVPQPMPNQPVVVNRAAPVQPVPVQPMPVRTNQPVPVTPQMPQVPPAARAVAQAPVVAQQNRPLPVTAAAASPTAARPIPVSTAARPIPVTVDPNALVRADEEESAEGQDVEKKVIKSAPPWLVSTVIHMVALLIMGLLFIVKPMTHAKFLEVVYAEEIGVQLQDPTLTTGLMEKIDIAEPVLSKDVLQANDPFAAPPEIAVTFDGVSATNTIEAPSIGMALSGREKGAKQALLGAYGGTATTEEAVRRGLEWLKRNQEKSGMWSLAGPYTDGGSENKVAATAMALLAFQGAGHTHKTGEYKKEVAHAWKALLELQNKDGVFQSEGAHNHRLYTQAQATIALCELYGMTKDEKYRKLAQLSVDYAVKIQDRQGGWRYTPGEGSDLSVTGWFVMALQSAMMAGLEVPSPTLDNISKFLDSVQSDEGSRYSYQTTERGATLSMTAEGLLCRQYLGWAHDDPRLVRGVEYVNQNTIDWNNEKNVYYWYYATQVTHHMEGAAWKKWNNVMRQELPKNQVKEGKEGGSWDPAGDRWASYGGRLYETCLCIYMLEVYYRHLPIYKWRGK